LRHEPADPRHPYDRNNVVRAFADATLAPIRRWISIRRTEHDLRRFRSLHPGKSFAEFYAWQVGEKLCRGRAHRTLGKRKFDPRRPSAAAPMHDAESFAAGTSSLLGRLRELGLASHHTVVEFGCGSLRIGQHFIRILEPGRYWGLDITDRFFSDGLTMLDARERNAKSPACRVISSSTLDEAAQAKPDFVVSIAVLKHVPEHELELYFGRVARLMHPGTRFAFDYWESDREFRMAGKSWSYSQRRIFCLIRRIFPKRPVDIVRIEPRHQESPWRPSHRIAMVGQRW